MKFLFAEAHFNDDIVTGQLAVTKQLNNGKLEGNKSDTSHQDSNSSRKKISGNHLILKM